MGLAERALLAYTVVRTKLHVFRWRRQSPVAATYIVCRSLFLWRRALRRFPGRFAPLREMRGFPSGRIV